MPEEKYTAEQLEQMADQLLQEAAPAQEKPAKGGLDEKTIASLPTCWTSWTWRASRWTPSTTLWSSWASR